jgi:hypothetical protein
MSHAKKVVMAADMEPIKDEIKDKIYGKMYKTVDIIAKLADIKGYDKTYRIQAPDGSYMPNSNLITLITHAMSSGRVLHGEQEFIALLYRAGVEPELVLNDNVKSKLISFYSKSLERPVSAPIVYENRQSIKRPLDDEENEEVRDDQRQIKRQKTVAIVNPSKKRPLEEEDEEQKIDNWQYPGDDK